MLGAAVEANMTFDDVEPEDYAGIVVVGGTGSQEFLWTNKKLRSLVRAFFEQGKVVAAICLGRSSSRGQASSPGGRRPYTQARRQCGRWRKAERTW
jgi:GMP synthase-like glutamine amidotransferase